MQKTVLSLAALTLACGVLAGCGDAKSDSAAGPSTAAQSNQQAGDKNRECGADDIKVSGDFGDKPDITLPTDCKPPTKLVVKDLKEGTGDGAKEGDNAKVNYELKTWSDGKVLDNSYDRGEPFEVENIGKASVIDGWNKGLVGMKKDARRLLIIPPDLGYGQGGQGIKPNETLVFVMDGVSITSPTAP